MAKVGEFIKNLCFFCVIQKFFVPLPPSLTQIVPHAFKMQKPEGWGYIFMGKRLHDALFYGCSESRKLHKSLVDKANCRCVRYVIGSLYCIYAVRMICISGASAFARSSGNGQCESLE